MIRGEWDDFELMCWIVCINPKHYAAKSIKNTAMKESQRKFTVDIPVWSPNQLTMTVTQRAFVRQAQIMLAQHTDLQPPYTQLQL